MSWTDADIAKRNAEIFGAYDSVHEGKDCNPVILLGGAKQNKWEAEYEKVLKDQWAHGIIHWYGFEAIKLRLANNTYYTPDFAMVTSGVLSFCEVKGMWRDDARVKFKVAAEQFPFWFYAIRKKKVSEGGGWEVIDSILGRGRI